MVAPKKVPKTPKHPNYATPGKLHRNSQCTDTTLFHCLITIWWRTTDDWWINILTLQISGIISMHFAWLTSKCGNYCSLNHCFFLCYKVLFVGLVSSFRQHPRKVSKSFTATSERVDVLWMKFWLDFCGTMNSTWWTQHPLPPSLINHKRNN